jgi:hypothetical protein
MSALTFVVAARIRRKPALVLGTWLMAMGARLITLVRFDYRLDSGEWEYLGRPTVDIRIGEQSAESE